MIQPILGRLSAGFSAGTNFAPFIPKQWAGTQGDHAFYFPVAGVVNNIQFQFNQAPGVGTSYAITLQKNGSDTALVMTLADANTIISSTGTPISVAAGDRLNWKVVSTGAVAGCTLQRIYMEFNSTADRTSIFGEGFEGINSISPAWFGLLASNERDTTAATNVQCVAPCAGTISGIIIWGNGTGTTGPGYDFYIYKNGVKQDGAGGTVDTHLLFPSTTNGLVSASATFSLPVAAGDLLYLEYTRSGTSSSKTGGFCVSFVGDKSNQIPLCGKFGSMSTTTGNQFTGLGSYDTLVIAGTEFLTNVPFRKLQLENLYVKLTAAPGATETRTFAVRKSTADTTITCVIADAATTGNDVAHKAKYTVGDTIGIREAAGSAGTVAALGHFSVMLSVDSEKGAQGGNGNKKGGGGGLTIQMAGGVSMLNTNPGLDIGITA